jgi:ABC-type multidrug transport system fused ATPase/permease subunit
MEKAEAIFRHRGNRQGIKIEIEISLGKSRPIEWRDAITLDEVSFFYPGTDRPVLDRFSLTIPKNMSIGFTGPTGK